MKIAWFTPFSQKSAIGKVGGEICRELSRGNEVTIWAFETEDTIQTDLRVIHYVPDNINIDELKEYDHVVYNMGNNYRFHHAIWDVMKQFPGILILHDRTYQNFFRVLCDETKDAGGFERILKELYGSHAASQAMNELRENPASEKMQILSALYSMREKFFPYATGVFSHSCNFISEISEEYFGPAGFAYLPLPENKKEAELPQEYKKLTEKILLVSTGIVHPVKRNHIIAEVLAEYPHIAEKVNFVLVGDFGGEYGEKLEQLSQNQLKDCMYLLGYQPDSLMNALLANADICVNLRYPNSEVCSLSLIEQMSFSKPVIVTDSGIYSEIPSDCVVKIPLIEEKRQLKEKLELLVGGKDARRTIGQNAGKFTADYCRTQVYADQFLKFCSLVKNAEEENLLVKQTLDSVNTLMKEMGLNYEEVPGPIDHVIRQYEELFQVQKQSVSKANKTLGIWYGFSYHVPDLHREGISKYITCLVEGLIREYPLDVEIWCYEHNLQEINIIFSTILGSGELKDRLKIITEQNWQKVLPAQSGGQSMLWDDILEKDSLCEVAREFSRADVFMPVINYLDSVVRIGKPIVAPAHDLVISYEYDAFTQLNEAFKSSRLNIEWRAKNLARANAKMVCSSKYIRDNHVLKTLRSVRQEEIQVIPTPLLASIDPHGTMLTENETRAKFSLYGPYLFYASQIRPHKNVVRMLHAFKRVISSKPDLLMVFTGNCEEAPDVKAVIGELQLDGHIIFTGNLPEPELFALYRYAAVIPCATLMEGNFPAQATEALVSRRPLVLSDIPIVRERFELFNLQQNEGNMLLLFDPYDVDDFAEKMLYALENEQAVIKNQEPFVKKLEAYTWSDVAKVYYPILFGADSN